KGLHQVLRASAPPAQFRDEDGIDRMRLGKRHDLLALWASVIGPRGRFLEYGNDIVAGALGEGAQVSFLALTRLVVGAHAAVDCGLSQLNPLNILIRHLLKSGSFWVLKSVLEKL